MPIYAHGSFTLDRTYGVSGIDTRVPCGILSWQLVTAGGMAANVLKTIAAAGESARAIAVLGDDDSGRFILQDLNSSDIDTRFVSLSTRARTKEVIALVDLNTKDHTFYFLDGNQMSYAAPSGTEFHSDDILILDEATPASLRLAAAARRQNCAVILNLGSIKGDVERLITMADVVVCSEGFLVLKYPGYSIPEALKQVQALRSGGIPCFATLGAAGAVYVRNTYRKHQQAQAVDLVSAVGAGDTFVAGIVLSRLHHLSVPDSLILSSSMAARCCARRESALSKEDIRQAAKAANIPLRFERATKADAARVVRGGRTRE